LAACQTNAKEVFNMLIQDIRTLIENYHREADFEISEHYYETLIVQHESNTLKALSDIISSAEDDESLKKALVAFLATLWALIKHSLLSYTSLPDHPLTSLLCKIASLIATEASSPISLLMPEISFEPIAARYPDLEALSRRLGIKPILKTHILNRDGHSLIPLALLYQEALSDPEPLANIYFDVFHPAYEAKTPEDLKSHTTLDASEIERLFMHSPQTRIVKQRLSEYQHLLSLENNLLSHLKQLLLGLYENSVMKSGDEMLSDTLVFTKSQSFFAFYNALDGSDIDKIPEPIKVQINLIAKYFSEKHEEKAGIPPIGSCFATRYDDLNNAIKGHEAILASIGVNHEENGKLLHQAKIALDTAISELKDRLINHPDNYEGYDKPHSNQSVIDSFKIPLLLHRYEDIIPLLRSIAPRDLAHLFKDPSTVSSFFNHVRDLGSWALLIYELPVEILNALLSAIGKPNLRRTLVTTWAEFFRFYESFSKEKQLILLNNIDFYERDETGNTALLQTIVSGMTEVALALIDHRINLSDTDILGNIPLILAIDYNNLAVVNALIAAGVNLNAIDDDGDTALFFAIRLGYTEIALALIEHGADLSYKNEEGETALLTALALDNTIIARALIEKRQFLNEADDEGNTPLIIAAYQNNLEIVALLIAYDADLNRQDSEGNTALILAIIEDNHDIARLLIKINAVLDIENEEGQTALGLAIDKGLSDIVHVLLEKGAPLDKLTDEQLSRIGKSTKTQVEEDDLPPMDVDIRFFRKVIGEPSLDGSPPPAKTPKMDL
jgi:ankyrin repeat protein